jgi:sirohydrochlorin cobaltochelatase
MGQLMSSSYDGIILIAHGARDARWMEPFYKMRSDIQTRLGKTPVALAFMEFTTPTLADAADELDRAGAKKVLVTPIFLSGGGHVAHDIPKLIEPERARHPHMQFSASGAIGEEPEVRRGMEDAVVRLLG